MGKHPVTTSPDVAPAVVTKSCLHSRHDVAHTVVTGYWIPHTRRRMLHTHSSQMWPTQSPQDVCSDSYGMLLHPQSSQNVAYTVVTWCCPHSRRTVFHRILPHSHHRMLTPTPSITAEASCKGCGERPATCGANIMWRLWGSVMRRLWGTTSDNCRHHRGGHTL